MDIKVVFGALSQAVLGEVKEELEVAAATDGASQDIQDAAKAAEEVFDANASKGDDHGDDGDEE